MDLLEQRVSDCNTMVKICLNDFSRFYSKAEV